MRISSVTAAADAKDIFAGFQFFPDLAVARPRRVPFPVTGSFPHLLIHQRDSSRTSQRCATEVSSTSAELCLAWHVNPLHPDLTIPPDPAFTELVTKEPLQPLAAHRRPQIRGHPIKKHRFPNPLPTTLAIQSRCTSLSW